MSERSIQVHGSSLGLGTLLTVLFVALKLTGQITWSWWWVLSPLWIGFSLFVFAFVLSGLALLVAIVIASRATR